MSDPNNLEEYSAAIFALEKEYHRSLKTISSGYREAFAADGYSVVYARAVNVRGSSHYRAARDVEDGDVLKCVAEPDNAYDYQAVKLIDWDGRKVGYLARDSDARESARAVMDGGSNVYALVVESTAFDTYGKIKIILVKPDENAVYNVERENAATPEPAPQSQQEPARSGNPYIMVGVIAFLIVLMIAFFVLR